jgi:hypothetical protein
MPIEPALLASAGRMPKRSQHGATGGPEGASGEMAWATPSPHRETAGGMARAPPAPAIAQVASRRVFSTAAGGTTDTTGDRGRVRRRWFADGRHAPP